MREERISPLHCSFLLQNDPRRMKINQSNTRQNICIFFFFFYNVWFLCDEMQSWNFFYSRELLLWWVISNRSQSILKLIIWSKKTPSLSSSSYGINHATIQEEFSSRKTTIFDFFLPEFHHRNCWSISKKIRLNCLNWRIKTCSVNFLSLSSSFAFGLSACLVLILTLDNSTFLVLHRKTPKSTFIPPRKKKRRTI